LKSKTVYPSQEVRRVEKRTFSLHLVSQFLNGISFGILLLQDIILKKSLAGTDFEVTILIFLVSSAFLFSIYGAEIINRSNNPGRTIIIMGVISKGFLLAIPLFENAGFFIFCIAAMSYVDSMIKPAWNIVYKHNYTEQNRSKLYSYASSLHVGALLLFSTFIGFILDVDYRVYKILYPAAGIVDIIAFMNLAKLINMAGSTHNEGIIKFPGKLSGRLFKDVLVLPVRNMLKIFRENKAFLRFEIYFFFYGVALMMAGPAVPVFLVDYLHLDYSPVSIAKGLLFHTAMILFTPLMGKMHGTGSPMKFCGWLFLLLASYPLLLMATPHINIPHEAMLYITYFIFGVAMSGITIAWSLSSIFYAPPAMVSNYQAVHITLTGVRGIFSPFLGYALLKWFSVEAAFLVSGFFFVVSGVLMLRGGRNEENAIKTS
jgi:hypothetical protein